MVIRTLTVCVLLVAITSRLTAQVEAADVTPVDASIAERENTYWVMESLVTPWGVTFEGSAFTQRADGTVAVGTRRGDVWILSEVDDPKKRLPRMSLFASGLHEILGIAERDGHLFVTQQGEVTRLVDEDRDGQTDLYECVSSDWGFGGEHEFTYGAPVFDQDGYLWVAHCLTGSYTSEHKFRGWAQKISADGTTIPMCSGVRSPGGVGINKHGDVFYTENQGPWNGACGLKHLRPKGFMGHPISFPWYEFAPNMGPPPKVPKGGRNVRQHDVVKEIPELVPTSVVFPYKKMGQSASAIVLDASGGGFGPFQDQLFVGDYTLSLVMRVTLEKIDGVYQGACYPFRQGFSTGVIGMVVTKKGTMLTGGCARGWPTRGTRPFDLQRLRWTGRTPFELREMRLTKTGFALEFTRPVDPRTAADLKAYELGTYTYRYQKVYGSPEVDHTTPTITSAQVQSDGKTVLIDVDGLRIGHVHELHLPGLKASNGEPMLHPVAYYTLNKLRK